MNPRAAPSPLIAASRSCGRRVVRALAPALLAGLIAWPPTLGFSQPAISPTPDMTPLSSRQAANRKLVLDFWRVVIETHDASHIGDYFAADLIQHNPNMAGGIDGFVRWFDRRNKDIPKRPVEPVLRNPPVMVLADGDLVQLVFKRRTPDPSDPSKTYDRYTFDLYRVRSGKIVEHWDAVLKDAPAK